MRALALLLLLVQSAVFLTGPAAMQAQSRRLLTARMAPKRDRTFNIWSMWVCSRYML